MSLVLSANWPYIGAHRAPRETWERFAQLNPRGVLVMSHTHVDDIRQLLANSNLTRWHVRLKGNRKWWPKNILDKEYPDELSPYEIVKLIKEAGQEPIIVFWNEPCLELTPDWRADDNGARQEAAFFYADATHKAINEFNDEFDHVEVVLAPLSQGGPETKEGVLGRFDYWIAQYQSSGLLARATRLADHCYFPGGLDFSDQSWGSRYKRLLSLANGRDLDILEANDNGQVPDEARANAYVEYVKYIWQQGDVATLSLFQLPGQEDAVSWWPVPSAAAQGVGALEVLLAGNPAPVEPPIQPPAPIPGPPWTQEDVIQAGKAAADAQGLPQLLLIALGVAESGLRADAARYAYRDSSGRIVNETARAEAALARGDFSDFAGVLVAVENAGSNDVSFGAWQQTVRWADEGTHEHTVENVVYIRNLYFDPYYAAQKAAQRIKPYWVKYNDVLEALCRYNKPSIPGSQNPNIENYKRGIRRANEILGGTPIPEPPVDSYTPTIYYDNGFVAGSFARTPKGCVLHGSRSGRRQTLHAEFEGTRNWAKINPDGLGWNVTIGEDEISIHMSPQQWGWHAASASDDYLSVEFANPLADYDVTDKMVRTFCWWWKTKVLPAWPDIPLHFPTHAEVEKSGETGRVYGKTDVYPLGDARTEDLRRRILAGLVVTPVPVYDEIAKLRDELAQARTLIGVMSVDVARDLQSALDRFGSKSLPKKITKDDLRNRLIDLTEGAQAVANTLRSFKP